MTDTANFRAADMIEVQHDNVALVAINARMLREVSENQRAIPVLVRVMLRRICARRTTQL